jgi:hypothetical protein
MRFYRQGIRLFYPIVLNSTSTNAAAVPFFRFPVAMTNKARRLLPQMPFSFHVSNYTFPQPFEASS